ncbi:MULTISPECIES: nucleotidyltransferase domain-containing protein [unclassified Pseudomonas]|uniref:nucleotidyltransferase domain-containing protein n=1 Tax=Pseudomonas TaxID=286 RepID=UPI0005961C62|nr:MULTISPECIES: nucleotidyltransferase domain-containing protein [unclassified Pseudomonas]MBD0687718.1 nucleotidyltransferase domain-containing protein [Pseudomonas sp. PSB18]
MVSVVVQEEVRSRLRRAESEHEVKVLLAVESGSRAWGFASPNSDYDARFIYVNKPEWYLSVGLEERRDVIEYPIVDDMDINGWDLRKALRLFWKSNPGFVEWLQSTIVYEHSGSFHERAKALLPQVYSVESGIYHYRSMAKTNYRGYLQAPQVPLKKYFYVLRPLLSVRWLEQFNTPAPIEFDTLRTVIEGQSELQSAIDDLLAIKRASPELGLSPQIMPIQQFIERELLRLEAIKPTRSERKEVEPLLSTLFRSVLEETWG